MKLSKNQFEYYTTETSVIVNNPESKIEDVTSALAAVEEIVFANVSAIATTKFKSILKFLVDYKYQLKMGKIFALSDTLAPDCLVDDIEILLNTATCYNSMTLGELMPNFNPLANGKAKIINSDNVVQIVGFVVFENTCPNGWIGGFEIDYGNSAATGWLRPDELVFIKG